MAWVEALDVLPRLLSERIGAEISGARLFVSLLYVYPIAIIQRVVLHGANANLHHIYNTITSALLLHFNFGSDSIYFLANILAAYVILRTFKSSRLAVISSIILNLGFLGYAYLIDTAPKTAVTWTAPHCVLTLKLIGVQWDVYDGAQQDVKGKEETAIASVPSLLELLGFSYYPASMMTGPQISFRKYRLFTDGQFNEDIGSSWRYAMQRLTIGIVLVVAFPLLSPYIPTQYFYTQEFKSQWLVLKVVTVAIWGQVVLLKYLGVWLVAEGSCIFSGMAYNGKDAQGIIQWDQCANVKVNRYFTATQTQHFIDSFNINTNKWVLTYVYKRLRFLNNKNISQGVSLVFLAGWHGFSSGYFMCFLLEFLIVNGEKAVVKLCSKKAALKSLVNHPLLTLPSTLMSKLLATFALSYALISFELHSYNLYMEIYADLLYAVHIGYALAPLLCTVLSAMLTDDSPKTKST
ncbi:lysophospholipid acyltransferase 5-like [Watersipora subatra]|uniref:lysophospholipid acyltransferase 5-like n=1 Tax=Watersipora subatra TaxID=2589382 RepID=UPI00355B7DE4